jgi:PPM family protein phosphatase
MSPFETASATQGYRERCEDRIAVFTHRDRTVVVVADGAGGSGSGDNAAQTVVREVESEYLNIHSAAEWASLLRQIDCRISNGESTAVVVDIRTIGIAGASVGDSRAIKVEDGAMSELTVNQKRKPLLGSGIAEPIGFVSPPLVGMLLVGTDGFFNYTKPNAILSSMTQTDFQTLPRRCIELVQLPSGTYWDDVSVVAIRNRPRSSTRQRFIVD